jgi:iron complex outermembrane receptor protein
LSGGTNLFNFQGSLGYTKQEGVIVNTGKEIITTRLTANQKSFKDKLEIRYGINTSVINRDFLLGSEIPRARYVQGVVIFSI